MSDYPIALYLDTVFGKLARHPQINVPNGGFQMPFSSSQIALKIRLFSCTYLYRSYFIAKSLNYYRISDAEA
jgi:hypothetical protein